MRVGKKTNVIDKKTRSCVVRLEKVAQNYSSSSPTLDESHTPQTNTRNISLILTTMGATPKGRKVAALQQEEKTSRGPIKKRPVENSGSNPQTPQQKLLASTTANMSSVRSNQKIKVIPRANKAKPPVATPIRDETPPPTVAAGRSRRAIKPNPKYASEDLVTPKVVRNVALGSSGARGGSSAQSAGDVGKYRKMSSSSDDFYNRNSEDDFENDINDDDEDEDLQVDKAYQANEKEEQDSDFSDVEDAPPTRTARPRGRPRKQQQEPTVTSTQHSTAKLSGPTPVSIIKRTPATNAANLRSAPSQLQQIRRSLASANAQRNHNLISGTVTAQKRKLDDTQDSSENEDSYTLTRKQMLLSTSSGVKVKVPVKDSKSSITTSTPLTNKSRALGLQKISATSTPQQTLNGGKMNSSRKMIEIPAQKSSELNTKQAMRSVPNRQATAVETYVNSKSITSNSAQQIHTTAHAKMLFGKTAASSNKVRSRSPKPTATQKDTQSNKTTTVQSSATSSTQNAPKKLPTLISNRLGADKTKSLNSAKSSANSTSSSNTTTTSVNHTKSLNTKTKSSSQSTAAAAAKSLTSEKTSDTTTQEDSPNSTMDDFETMPTFTIVNVNDIINKKGDVLITKSKTNNKPTVIEFSESISLDDEDDDDEGDSEDLVALSLAAAAKATKSLKLPTSSNKKDVETKKSPLSRSNESLRKTLPTKPNSALSSATSTTAPQILNHKLGLRNKRVTPKTTTLTLTPPDKPAPRILNSMVAKKTQPVKPMIANLDDSADESFPLSLDEDEEEETEDEVESKTISKSTLMTEKANEHHSAQEVDTEDTESQNTEEDDSMLQTSAALTTKLSTVPKQRKRKVAPAPIAVSSNKKRLTPAAAKENSLAATNQQVNDSKLTTTTTMPQRKNVDKVVISKQGDKIIKKITCFETWYVINMPMETKRHTVMKNQLEMPLIRLANNATSIELPTDLWSCKVTLYELTANTLAKSTLVTYTGDLSDHNIHEEDRGKYQPSCVMFRRSVDNRITSRMPYDRAVIFKNKTFYTNIEGKNVRLVGAPSIINSEKEIEILLEVVDNLTLQSDFVEHVSIVQ